MSLADHSVLARRGGGGEWDQAGTLAGSVYLLLSQHLVGDPPLSSALTLSKPGKGSMLRVVLGLQREDISALPPPQLTSLLEPTGIPLRHPASHETTRHPRCLGTYRETEARSWTSVPGVTQRTMQGGSAWGRLLQRKACRRWAQAGPCAVEGLAGAPGLEFHITAPGPPALSLGRPLS